MNIPFYLSSAAVSRARKALAPATMQKRVQEAVAVHCLSWVYQMNSMKLKEVQSTCFQAYHGQAEKDIVSFALQCISGQGPFEELWDKEEEASGVCTLELKTAFSQRDDCRYISGSSITLASVSHANQKSPTLIDGRAIYNLGLNSLKHCKKALAFEKQFLGPDGNLPSGTNEDDLNSFILNGMYKSLKSGSIDTVLVDEEDENDDNNNNNNNTDRPYDWTFPGWIAYKLFGPHANRAFRSPLLLIGDWQILQH